MAISSRGLKNIRTLSGRVDPGALPYRGYMQITCLEMEKARRAAERSSAARRIAEIDARVREIEREKRQLLEAVARGAPLRSTRLSGLEVRTAAARRPGFRIRY